MINGVSISPRRVTEDIRGSVLHMLKRTDDVFTDFGEIYFSKINVGKEKAWRRHRLAVSQLVVPIGSVRFILFDDRDSSSTRNECMDVVIGESNHQLLTVPPMVWYAFSNVGADTALVGNCSSLPHDPDESDRRDFSDSRMPRLIED